MGMRDTSAMRALALTLVLVGVAARSLAQSGATEVRVCIPSEVDQAYLDECTRALSAANTDAVTFTCVLGGSTEACTALLKSGGATLTRMGATQMYDANQDTPLAPLVAESLPGTEGATYYSVAVVPASACSGPGVSLASLAGKRSCHTGYGRTAGWTMPVGYLAESGAMPLVSTQSGVAVDAQSVASFFSQTCAPGSTDDGPAADGKAWDGLCGACKGNCSESDPYADYAGTLRCVMEGGGDVAFTKHNIPLDHASDGSDPQSWSSLAKSELRLMCPGGGCAPVDDYTSCNLAKVPSGALVAPADLQGSQLARAIQAALVEAASDAAFLTSANQYVFSETTEGLKAHNSSLSDYYEPETLQAITGSRRLQAASAAAAATTEVKLCIPSEVSSAYVTACTQAMSAANTGSVRFTCIPGGSPDGCSLLIKNGAAHLTKLGATQQYTAYKEFGLVPLVTEFLGNEDGASYYSVAVVPASACSNPGVSLASLAGKRSCHTGYGRTAGWTMPVGYLAESGAMPVVRSQSGIAADAQSVASFFSQTCAPGTTDDGPLSGGRAWDRLCSACKGDCSESDPYADYEGTLRCVMEGAGDVAFTKHNIPLEYARDGTTPESWSSLAKSELRLMCPGGGCAPVDDYKSCNLAKVPAGALVGPAELQGTQLGRAIQAALVDAANDERFLASTKALMGTSGFVFADAATGLRAQNKTFEDYYGQVTLEAVEGVEALKATGSSASSSSGGSSGGVSSGAAAGIGIGCAVGGALIAAAITYYLMKKKTVYLPHLDESAKVIPSTAHSVQPYV